MWRKASLLHPYRDAQCRETQLAIAEQHPDEWTVFVGHGLVSHTAERTAALTTYRDMVAEHGEERVVLISPVSLRTRVEGVAISRGRALSGPFGKGR